MIVTVEAGHLHCPARGGGAGSRTTCSSPTVGCEGAFPPWTGRSRGLSTLELGFHFWIFGSRISDSRVAGRPRRTSGSGHRDLKIQIQIPQSHAEKKNRPSGSRAVSGPSGGRRAGGARWMCPGSSGSSRLMADKRFEQPVGTCSGRARAASSSARGQAVGVVGPSPAVGCRLRRRGPPRPAPGAKARAV